MAFSEATARLGLDTPYDALLWAQASGDVQRYTLFKGAIAQESGWNPAARRDERRADGSVWDSSYGLMQLLLSTARQVAGNPGLTAAELLEPSTNLVLGTTYLNGLLDRYGSDGDAVAAYNAGTPRKNAAGQYINSRGEPTVQAHVDSVLTYQNWYLNQLQPAPSPGDAIEPTGEPLPGPGEFFTGCAVQLVACGAILAAASAALAWALR